MASFKLLSSAKKDDLKIDIINHYRKIQFLYDFRKTEYKTIYGTEYILLRLLSSISSVNLSSSTNNLSKVSNIKSSLSDIFFNLNIFYKIISEPNFIRRYFIRK